MRILVYYPGALAGEFGTANAVRAWAEALAHGHEVTLGVDGRSRTLSISEEVRVLEIPHRRLGRRLFPGGDFARAVSGHDVVTLHGAWDPALAVAAVLCRRSGVPYVLTPHGGYAPQVLERRRVRKWAYWLLAERWLLSGAAAVHVFFEEQVLQLPEPARGRAVVVPNPLHLPSAAGPVQGNRDGAVVWYGRYDIKHKGLDLLVRALALLAPDQRPMLQLFGVDHRGGRERLVCLADGLGVRPWVSVSGPVYGAEKWAVLAQARGFAYPSRLESCPTAVVEAALAGLPILVAPYPLGRLLASHGAAHLVQWEERSLAEGMQWLGSGEAILLARRASRVVRELFDPSRLAASWTRQVEDLLAHATRRHAPSG